MALAALVCLFFLVPLPLCTTTEFPLEEFFKTAVNDFRKPDNFDAYSKKHFLCGGSCCDCSEDCMLTKTCCIDKFWDDSKPVPLTKYIDIFQQKLKEVKPLSCLTSLPFQTKYSAQAYKMVASCLPGAAKEDEEKCINDKNLQDFERLPVYGEDRYLYKNSFCAKCNFAGQYFPVNVTFGCVNYAKFQPNPPPDVEGKGSDTTTTTSQPNVLKYFSNCVATIEGNSRYRRLLECNPNFVEQDIKCSDSDLMKICNMYQGEIDKEKNVHCMVCKGRQYYPELIRQCFPKDSSKIFTWLVTISFGKDSTQVSSRDGITSYCKQGQKYNFIDGNCVETTCAPGYTFESTTCIRDSSSEVDSRISITNPKFLNCLTAMNASMYIKTNSTFNQTMFTKDFENDFSTEAEVFNLLDGSHDSLRVYKRIKKMSHTDVLLAKEILKNTSLSMWKWNVEIFIAPSTVSEITTLYGFDLSKHFTDQKICADNTLHDINNGNFSSSCDFLPSNASQSISQQNISLYLRIRDDMDEVAVLSHCESYHLIGNCGTIRVSSNYTFDKESKEISVFSEKQNKSFVYNPNDYLPSTENTFYVCATNPDKSSTISNDYDWEKPLINAEYYTSIVLTIISILFEILFILTFVFLKDHQNRGGFNILVIIIFVLISDLTFLMIAFTGGQAEVACKALAIVLHWSLLTVEFWGVVLVGDLTFHLLRPHAKSSTFTMRQLFSKILLCLVPITSVIIVCIVLDETNKLTIGYGRSGICWITSYYPKLGFFLIPSILAFTISLSLLSLTFSYLFRQEKSQRKHLKNSGRSDMNLATIALKLIVVLGLAELVGFIQIQKSNLTENEKIFNSTFSLLYAIVRSLRGALVFYFYLGNQKTLDFYKKNLGYQSKSKDIAMESRLTANSHLSSSANSTPILAR